MFFNPLNQHTLTSDSNPFDLKSLGFCLLTIILNAGPQTQTIVGSFTSMLTAMAAISTVAYNIARFYNDIKKPKN